MNLIKHIQFQQLINLILLIFVSYLNDTLQTSIYMVAMLMLYSGIFELLIKQKQYIPYSAFITALGVVLMVGWLKWYIPFFVITLSLLQKQFLKIDNKHIFNPSNFALISALIIFYPKALPIVGELGKESYIIYFVIFLGSLILIRVNRYLITLSFLLSYILLNWLIFGQNDPVWNFEHFISMLYSTSFIVFIFFMLTDPVTTPESALHQIYFGIFVAVLTVLLNFYIGIRVWHQFIALFLSSIIFTPLYRKLSKIDYTKLTITLILTLFFTLLIYLKSPIYFSM